MGEETSGGGVKAFADHFSDTASGYAAHRPTYPAALVDFLAEIAPGRALAWDCGCGSGQLSVLLAGRFGQVIATDASAAQIACAPRHAGVEYRCAPAEASGLAKGSVDLAVAAQAAHWFDLAAYYAEVCRVGRPGTAVALVSYGVMAAGEPIDRVIWPFYSEVLASYWPKERRHVEEGYRGLLFPFQEVETPPLEIRVSWRLPDLLGYVETWSAVRALRKAEGPEPVSRFRQSLTEAWQHGPAERLVRWPLAIRAGHL